MKSLAIAVKDLTRSFRSAFALVFMFALPLLVTGMFYLMFGNLKNNDTTAITTTNVALVNLDQGSDQAGNLGETLVSALQSEGLNTIMNISLVKDAETAMQMVDDQQAGVAIIIPANFSQSFSDSAATAEIEFVQDPTLTIGPQIVLSVLRQITDSYAGIKIAVSESLKMVGDGSQTSDAMESIVQQYMAGLNLGSNSSSYLEVRSLEASAEGNIMKSLVGPIMAGMMIFFAFFTGASTASSILREDEEGTLQRLFSTPTSRVEVMRGKFISVGLTVAVQVSVLIAAARLIFGIEWGKPGSVALAVVGIILTASSFGIFISSLMKNMKQSGFIFGGVLTATGMLGMINIFTGNPQSTPLGIGPLFTPQGWASRAMLYAMDGKPVTAILPLFAAMLAISLAFFVLGVWRFNKRFA